MSFLYMTSVNEGSNPVSAASVNGIAENIVSISTKVINNDKDFLLVIILLYTFYAAEF